jgi:hypothetical protein
LVDKWTCVSASLPDTHVVEENAGTVDSDLELDDDVLHGPIHTSDGAVVFAILPAEEAAVFDNEGRDERLPFT